MKYSLGISNFLEEMSSLSHSVVFLYFFALIAEEGFLISPCSSLELCIQMLISFLFSFAFHFSSFHSYEEVTEYTEELYKKDLHDQDNHDGVITHLEPDILECEVKWALESITITKLMEMMDLQLSSFKS